jgi:hypothetical protein
MMKRKNILIFTILALCSNAFGQQYDLPASIKNAIPEKYKMTAELYHKAEFIINIDISLEIQSKYSCDDNLKDPCEIKISIYSVGNKDIVKMQEDMMPFSNYYPTTESHKAYYSEFDELVKYSETTLIDLPEGKGAYFTWIRKCIEAQHDEYLGTSFTSLFGNHSTRIGIDIFGNIDVSEAIAITKELYSVLSKFNYQNL